MFRGQSWTFVCVDERSLWKVNVHARVCMMMVSFHLWLGGISLRRSVLWLNVWVWLWWNGWCYDLMCALWSGWKGLMWNCIMMSMYADDFDELVPWGTIGWWMWLKNGYIVHVYEWKVWKVTGWHIPFRCCKQPLEQGGVVCQPNRRNSWKRSPAGYLPGAG